MPKLPAELWYLQQAYERNCHEWHNAFKAAYNVNREAALAILLWSRDVKGLGRRIPFRSSVRWLIKHHPADAELVIRQIPLIGCYSDLLHYVNSPMGKLVTSMIKAELDAGNPLMAKWLPRKGYTAYKIARKLGMSPKQYRKRIVSLNDTLEAKLTRKDYRQIDPLSEPMNAIKHHRNILWHKYCKQMGKRLRNYPEIDGEKVLTERDLPYSFPSHLTVVPIINTSAAMGSLNRLKSPMLRALWIMKTALQTTSSFAVFGGRNIHDAGQEDFAHIVKRVMQPRMNHRVDVTGWAEQLAEKGVKPDYLLIIGDRYIDDAGVSVHYGRLSTLFDGKPPQIVYWRLNAKRGYPIYTKRGVICVDGYNPIIVQTVFDMDLTNPRCLLNTLIKRYMPQA